VATVLNEIADLANVGVTLHQKFLPIDEQVSGACEMLGLDPLYVANEGIFIAVVDGSVTDDVVTQMRADGLGKNACAIGEIVGAHPGQVILASSIGGKRVVNYLTGDQLPRIC
jgi:hydrogenase expression/formation protein HypE